MPPRKDELLFFAVEEDGLKSAAIDRAPKRKPANDEVATVFAMLGGAPHREEKLPRAKRGGHARVFPAAAGWLRKGAGRA